MKSYRLSELTSSQVDSLKSRPRIDFSSIFATVTSKLFVFFFVDNFPLLLLIYCQVNPIIDAVRSNGDTAIKESVTHSLSFIFTLLISPKEMEMRILFCFRYTERFDKVQLNKVVEDMSELSVPEVVD